MQRAISGYHILMILTQVDGKINIQEDMVVRDWLAAQFPAKPDLDEAMAEISSLEPSGYDQHFQRHTDLFYRHSTKAERIELLQFAMNLIKADGVISKEENSFFDALYDAWSEEVHE